MNNSRFRVEAGLLLATLCLIYCVSAVTAQEPPRPPNPPVRPTSTPTPGRKRTTPKKSPPPSRKSVPFQPQNPHIELVLIPPGSFMMGSTNGDADEKPVHEVTINYSFYIGKYEVTQAQWKAVMGTTVRQERDKGNPGWVVYGEGDDYPIYYVNWYEAQEFIQRLNQIKGPYNYRLPTEAEWEYACRGGTTGDYAGNLNSMAWYGPQIPMHPVGRKDPNAFGLYDMHGNLWEWCEDRYHETYVAAPTDGSAWLNGGDQKYRVLRGGSWNSLALGLRSAVRFWHSPGVRDIVIGFRVVAMPRTTVEETRYTIKADVSLNNYEAYRRGDRFYIRIPKTANLIAEGLQVERIGNDLIISLRLQSGQTAHVEQRANQLDIVVTSSPVK